MNNNFIDYSRSLDLVMRINALIESDSELRKTFHYKGYGFLQAIQGPLFSEIKIWTRDGRIDDVQPRMTLIGALKSLSMLGYMWAVTTFSLLLVYVSRTRVFIFSGDKVSGSYHNDFRLNPLYEVLTNQRIGFFEIIHGIPGQEMVRKFLMRRRPVLYLEAIDALVYLQVRLQKMRWNKKLKGYHLTGFKEDETHLVRLLLAKYASAVTISKARVRFFEVLFGILRPVRLFSIDDIRHYNEVMLAARLREIPTYAIQHGHFTKYHTGWLRMVRANEKTIHPEHILVWSEYWKKELLRLGTYFTPAEIVVAGGQQVKSVAHESHPGIKLLIPYETDAPKQEVFYYIQRLIAVPGLQILFKIRPDHSYASQLDEYGLVEGEKVKVVSSLEEAWKITDIVAGTYSTLLYDAVLQKIPVVILHTRLDYGEGMITNGLAEKLDINDNIQARVESFASTPRAILDERSAKLSSEKRLEDTLIDILSHA